MASGQESHVVSEGTGLPAGTYLRSQWVPVMASDQVKASGAPIRTRLFGERYVAFRTADGEAGVVEADCPHRGASLALARNEGCSLRCLYHGWEIDVHGQVIDAPTEKIRHEFGARLNLPKYHTFETGGLLWAYLGGEDQPPPFPVDAITDDDKLVPSQH